MKIESLDGLDGRGRPDVVGLVEAEDAEDARREERELEKARELDEDLALAIESDLAPYMEASAGIASRRWEV